jgi:hypothetical protein
MAELKIEKHKWQPSFKDEIWITDKRKQEEFQITLKQGEDIEIEFVWDHGWGGRGTERMIIPVQLLKDLISELGM